MRFMFVKRKGKFFMGEYKITLSSWYNGCAMHKFRQGVFLPPQRRAHANQSEFYDTQKNECLWYLMVSCALHPVPQLQHVCKFQNIGHCPTANAGFCLHILIVLLCCSQLDFAAVGVIVSNEKLCLCWSKCCFHWNNGCWGSKVAFSRKKEFLMCLHK